MTTSNRTYYVGYDCGDLIARTSPWSYGENEAPGHHAAYEMSVAAKAVRAKSLAAAVRAQMPPAPPWTYTRYVVGDRIFVSRAAAVAATGVEPEVREIA